MDKVLLNVDYSDSTNKFWRDSYIKNKIFPVSGNIHETIKVAIEGTDGVKLTYNGRPRGNVFIDLKNGKTKIIGYMYKAKDEIDGKKAFFDVWVTIKGIVDYPLINLENILN